MSKVAGLVRAIPNPRQAALALLAATNKDKESHRHSTREIVIRIRTVPIYEGMRCRPVRCGMPSECESAQTRKDRLVIARGYLRATSERDDLSHHSKI